MMHQNLIAPNQRLYTQLWIIKSTTIERIWHLDNIKIAYVHENENDLTHI